MTFWATLACGIITLVAITMGRGWSPLLVPVHAAMIALVLMQRALLWRVRCLREAC